MLGEYLGECLVNTWVYHEEYWGNTLGSAWRMLGEMIGEGSVYSQFTILGHHEFKQTILSKSQRIKDLKQMEVALKETAKLNTEKLRKKMIQDGAKNLEKRRAEIETYKLKVVELKLWKRKWQTRQRSLQLKKRKRKCVKKNRGSGKNALNWT